MVRQKNETPSFPPLGWSSCVSAKSQCVPDVMTKNSDSVGNNTVTEVHNIKYEGKRTRFVSNSNANQVKLTHCWQKNVTKNSHIESNKPIQVKARTIWSSVNSNQNCSVKVCKQECTSTPDTEIKSMALDSNRDPGVQLQKQECTSTVNPEIGSINLDTPEVTAKVISPPGVSVDIVCTGKDTAVESSEAGNFTAEVISATGDCEDCPPSRVENTTIWSKVNSDKVVTHNYAFVTPYPLYDAHYIGVQDKFANSILHVGQFNGITPNVDTEIHHKWRNQSDFTFGFVPLAEQIMPKDMSINDSKPLSPIEMHSVVRATGKPNFMAARLPVKSQLNVKAWKMNLTKYWDQQLLQLLEFGFPLHFNRNCPLRHEQGNHKSATEFPTDIDAYIEEE